MRKQILLLLFPFTLFAQQITLEWLNSKPKGVYKDFYIWQYLKQDIKPSQALKAIEQVRYLNHKIFHRFSQKYNDDSYKLYSKCVKMGTKKLIKQKDYCIESGLSFYDATKLSKNELTGVIEKLNKNYPAFSKRLNILNSPAPFKALLKSDNKTFFNTFNECGSVYRLKHFNETFPLEFLNRLKSDEKDFDRTVKRIVTNLDMKKAQRSLLYLPSKNISFKTLFHLAINAIRHGEEKFALNYLDQAYKKAYYQMEKDNITFWQYLLTKEEKYLKKLSSSWDVNIYSIYANEKLNKPLDNIVFNIKQNGKSSSYNVNDPFKWLYVLNDTKKKMGDIKMQKYNNLFSSEDTLPHLAFVKERYDRYKNSYFITPFKDIVSKYDNKRKTLIYSIARQESRFIPTSISFAYAMGTMQIMPFLSKAIAKELNDPYDIYKQLDPSVNIKYADHHLDYLERKLKHPLLIAYAYNGGIGFTTRSLQKGLFEKGKYEPFLSMELLQFDETKKYGKKVLANYYVYHNLLNKEKIKISGLLKSAVKK